MNLELKQKQSLLLAKRGRMSQKRFTVIVKAFGSRLGCAGQYNILVAYAQSPNREKRGKDHHLTNQLYKQSRKKIHDCLVGMKVVYELEIIDDYLENKII